MIIQSPITNLRLVQDYEFSYSTGGGRTLTVDTAAGDTVEYVEGGIRITLVAKQSPLDPSQRFPKEVVTIFSNHLIEVREVEREVHDLTPEQKESFRQTVQELAGTSIH